MSAEQRSNIEPASASEDEGLVRAEREPRNHAASTSLGMAPRLRSGMRFNEDCRNSIRAAGQPMLTRLRRRQSRSGPNKGGPSRVAFLLLTARCPHGREAIMEGRCP